MRDCTFFKKTLHYPFQCIQTDNSWSKHAYKVIRSFFALSYSDINRMVYYVYGVIDRDSSSNSHNSVAALKAACCVCNTKCSQHSLITTCSRVVFMTADYLHKKYRSGQELSMGVFLREPKQYLCKDNQDFKIITGNSDRLDWWAWLDSNPAIRIYQLWD